MTLSRPGRICIPFSVNAFVNIYFSRHIQTFVSSFGSGSTSFSGIATDSETCGNSVIYAIKTGFNDLLSKFKGSFRMVENIKDHELRFGLIAQIDSFLSFLKIYENRKHFFCR